MDGTTHAYFCGNVDDTQTHTLKTTYHTYTYNEGNCVLYSAYISS